MHEDHYHDDDDDDDDIGSPLSYDLYTLNNPRNVLTQ
jgi:hypothetical protein